MGQPLSGLDLLVPAHVIGANRSILYEIVCRATNVHISMTAPKGDFPLWMLLTTLLDLVTTWKNLIGTL